MRIIYAILTGLVIVSGIAVWWMLLSVNHISGKPIDQVTFTVAKGQQLRSVALALEKEQLISSAGAWTLYAITQGLRSNILAGEYQLNHGLSGRQILLNLTNTHSSDQEVTVKIPDGSTNSEIAQLLEHQGVVSAKEFLAAVSATDSRISVKKEYSFLSDKPKSVDLQGYLFPDTYRFFTKTTAGAVVQKFLDNFDQRVTPAMRQAAKDHGHSLFEELTMASILEKELKTESDRANGADVFWKRFSIGMPLQSDATVNYVTGQSRLQPSIADTQAESLYNTYLHRGLPPGPINNPSISAIRSAINPQANEYYYYLTADGKTYFAKTLDEHNHNKQIYLR